MEGVFAARLAANDPGGLGEEGAMHQLRARENEDGIDRLCGKLDRWRGVDDVVGAVAAAKVGLAAVGKV